MTDSCPVCHSDLRRHGATCMNTDDAGVPCLGMTDTDAALRAAHNAYARDAIDLAELERRVSVALVDPPQRRFGVITVLR